MSRKQTEEQRAKLPTSGMIALGLIFMGLFICGLLMMSWSRSQYTQISKEMTAAQTEQAQLQAIQKKLQVELARLKSPERLAGIAKSSMGLKMPSSRQMVVVE